VVGEAGAARGSFETERHRLPPVLLHQRPESQIGSAVPALWFSRRATVKR
jgi:hypothetical protein